jgi:hypothetical protein
MEESVRQGWHTDGRAPYGYVLEEHQHPNPAKAREGKRKHSTQAGEDQNCSTSNRDVLQSIPMVSPIARACSAVHLDCSAMSLVLRILARARQAPHPVRR